VACCVINLFIVLRIQALLSAMQFLHSSSCFRSAGLRNDSDISIARRIRPVSCSKLDRTRSGNCLTPQRAQISTRHVQVAAAVAAPDQAPEAEQAAELQDIPSVLGAAAVEEPTVLAFDVPRLADLQLQAIINPEVSKVQCGQPGSQVHTCIHPDPSFRRLSTIPSVTCSGTISDWSTVT
jgi:hypothetical protein